MVLNCFRAENPCGESSHFPRPYGEYFPTIDPAGLQYYVLRCMYVYAAQPKDVQQGLTGGAASTAASCRRGI